MSDSADLSQSTHHHGGSTPHHHDGSPPAPDSTPPAPTVVPWPPTQAPTQAQAQAQAQAPTHLIPQPVRKSSPTRKILIAVAALVALGAAATGGAYAAAPDKVTGAFGQSAKPSTGQPVGPAAPTGDASARPPESTPGDGDAPPADPTPGSGPDVPGTGGAITVVAPDTLGGRPRIGDEGSGDAGSDGGMADDSGVPGVTATAKGIYGNAATQDIVIVTAVASTSGTPESRLSQFISGVSQELDVDNFTEADAGPLGGLARCGDGKLNGVPVAVCVWSDAGSAGALVRVLQSSPLFRPNFPALRAEVERRA